MVSAIIKMSRIAVWKAEDFWLSWKSALAKDLREQVAQPFALL